MYSCSNESFFDLNIHTSLISSLSKIGIKNPSTAQSKFIRVAEKSTGIIFQSKSGTGKTVSFCVVILNKILSHIDSNAGAYADRLFPRSTLPLGTSDIYCGDAVILLPTRELALQVYYILTLLSNEFGSIHIILITGGSDLLGDLRSIENSKPNIVIATPGRLQTILAHSKSDNIHGKGSVFGKVIFKTHTFVLDEADMLLDDHFFIQTKNICDNLINPFVQIIAVSATFIKPQLKKFEDMIHSIDDQFITTFTNSVATMGTKHDILPSMAPGFGYLYKLLSRTIPSFDEIIDWISKYERQISRIIISASHVNRTDLSLKSQSLLSKNKDIPTIHSFVENYICDTPNPLKCSETTCELTNVETPVLQGIKFYFAKILDAPTIVMQIGLKMNCILSILSHISYNKCIIFCNQSHSRIQISKILQAFGFKSYVSSSRLSHRERMTMLSDAIHTNRVVIICTDVMCRGIGVSGVDLVINMDMAVSKEVFLHRSGRAGRFGATGICVCICMQSEIETYEYLLYALNFTSESIQTLLQDNIPNSGIVDADGIWVFDPLISGQTYHTQSMDHIMDTVKITLVDSLLDHNKFDGKHKILGAILPDIRINLSSDSLLFYICFEINNQGLVEISLRYSRVEDNKSSDTVVLEISAKRQPNPNIIVYMPSSYSRILDCIDAEFIYNEQLHIIIFDLNSTTEAKFNGALVSLFPSIDLFRTLRYFHLNNYLCLKFADNDCSCPYRKTYRKAELEYFQYSPCRGGCSNFTDHIPQNMLDTTNLMIEYYANIAKAHSKRLKYIKLYDIYTKHTVSKHTEPFRGSHQGDSLTNPFCEHFTKWKYINNNIN